MPSGKFEVQEVLSLFLSDPLSLAPPHLSLSLSFSFSFSLAISLSISFSLCTSLSFSLFLALSLYLSSCLSPCLSLSFSLPLSHTHTGYPLLLFLPSFPFFPIPTFLPCLCLSSLQGPFLTFCACRILLTRFLFLVFDQMSSSTSSSIWRCPSRGRSKLSIFLEFRLLPSSLMPPFTQLPCPHHPNRCMPVLCWAIDVSARPCIWM